ncbi:MAG: HlyD family secretion protein [Rubrivivax sp.]|jgi:membrane fusion protein|nr:HlyD family secretion protein [Rubrivivax sp.]
MAGLFRPEALEAQRQGWLGGVQIARPPSLALLTVAVVVFALLLVAFVVGTAYTRKATVAGVLVPDRGLIRIVPVAAGTLIERRVTEGQAVQAGDVMFVIAVERPLLDEPAQSLVQRSLDERERSLRDAARQQQALAETRRGALERRLQAIEVERLQVEAESALLRQRLAGAEQSLARFEALAGESFVSPAQVQARREELLSLQAQALALARQQATLAREAAELDGERRELPIAARGALAGIERDLALLSREAAEQGAERRFVVRAPQAGTVTALLAEPGQSVSAASALAGLVPAGSALQAHLYAPSSAVGFLREGQEVRLRLEAFPYQKFGQIDGRVVQVSRTPLAAAELDALPLPARPAEAGEPLFRITVALGDDRQLPLVAGMRLQADVHLERRRLAEWMLAPLAGWAERTP